MTEARDISELVDALREAVCRFNSASLHDVEERAAARAEIISLRNRIRLAGGRLLEVADAA